MTNITGSSSMPMNENNLAVDFLEIDLRLRGDTYRARALVLVRKVLELSKWYNAAERLVMRHGTAAAAERARAEMLAGLLGRAQAQLARPMQYGTGVKVGPARIPLDDEIDAALAVDTVTDNKS